MASPTWRLTRCPACGADFKYPYKADQTLYTLKCRRANCATSFTIDIAPYLENKVEVLRDGSSAEDQELNLPEELLGKLEG
jgi:hypothetical protein